MLCAPYSLFAAIVVFASHKRDPVTTCTLHMHFECFIQHPERPADEQSSHVVGIRGRRGLEG